LNVVSFRGRLIAFLIATLVLVQGLSAAVGYMVLRNSALERGRQELSNASDAFNRQIEMFSRRVSDDVELLSLDYALRQAIAQHDYNTEFSALRNHGNRIGATRMMLIDLQGHVDADTGNAQRTVEKFPFPDLLDEATALNRGTAVANLDGGVYWIVAVPVLAPVPIAFIVACVPINDKLLDELSALASSPHATALATTGQDGKWAVVAHSGNFALAANEISAQSAAPKTATIATHNGAEYLAMTAPLPAAAHSPPIAAVFTYSLSEVLGAYGSVTTGMAVVILGALLFAVAGAFFIANSFSRPLERLVFTARRIAAGDYNSAEHVGGSDEIGQLSDALAAMSRSISEREEALTGAIDALEGARAEAVRANEAKSQFLANMSHELRTPLNAIVGFGEMMRDQILGPIGAKYADYAADICDSGQHLLQLIAHVLELSAAESGRLQLAHDPVDMGVLVHESIASQRHVARKARVDLTLKTDVTTWPELEGDAVKLKQAFNNLINNAVKYTPAGGRVIVSVELKDAHLRLAVSDTGVGIKPEDLAIVMRPFHTLRSALDARYQGAGLGLSFTKAVIEGHGGSLVLESTVGQGTTAIIDLPVSNSAHEGTLHNRAA
jgi:signal transduction histidine kinase